MRRSTTKSVEVVDSAFSENCTHIDLSLRESDGTVVTLRIAWASLAGVLARLSGSAGLVLETLNGDVSAKSKALLGQWEMVADLRAPTPTLECRTADGCGLMVAFGYDSITAMPQLEVAVAL
jgi:hypothetical protein